MFVRRCRMAGVVASAATATMRRLPLFQISIHLLIIFSMFMKVFPRKVMAITIGALVLLACGGGAATLAPPVPTLAPTVAPTGVPLPTATTAPAATAVPTAVPRAMPTDTPEAEAAATGFSDLVACLEDQLGVEVAQILVSGERQETAEEQAVVESCLLVTASGLSDQDLSPAVIACLEDNLGSGVVAVVGSGARELTGDEEAVLLDCLVTFSLAPPEEEVVSTLEACLAERLGADIAPLVASQAVPLNEEEAAALNQCLLVTALETPEEETLDAGVLACLEEELGTEIAAVVASGAVPLTQAEERVLGNCVLRSGLEATEGGLATGVVACLEEQLGADIATVVASGAIPLTAEEEAILGECLLTPSSETGQDAISETVAACLEERLGSDIAAVVASGAIPLTDDEEAVLGDCLLQEALGTNR